MSVAVEVTITNDAGETSAYRFEHPGRFVLPVFWRAARAVVEAHGDEVRAAQQAMRIIHTMLVTAGDEAGEAVVSSVQ